VTWQSPTRVSDPLVRRVFQSLTSYLGRMLRAVSVRVSATVSQSIPTGVWTAVSWDTAVYDDDGFYAAGAPTVLTVPDGWGGTFVLWVSADMQQASQRLRVMVNGNQSAVTSGGALSCTDQLAAGAAISIDIFQSSGGAVTVPTSAVFGVTRLGDL